MNAWRISALRWRKGRRPRLPASRAARGITLIEVVVYAGILAIVVGATTSFFMGTLRSFAVARAEQATTANLAVTLRAVELEIRHALRVYTPTSVFDSDSGQLSLRSTRNAPTDHTESYADLYIDNGAIYIKRDDGTAPVALTAGDVSVTAFRIERKTQGSADGLRLTISATPTIVNPALRTPVTLRAFVSTRVITP